MPLCPCLRGSALALSLCLPLGAFAQSSPAVAPGNGKLLLTGGVASIDGAAGGGLTPWAVTGSYATAGQWGATAHATRIVSANYALTGYGAALAYDDRIEVSLARQDFNAGVVAPGAVLRLDIVGAKLRLSGDAVLDTDRLMPQVAIGVEAKHLNPGSAVGGVLDGAGARRSGVDAYLSATKLILERGLLVNATLRATRANQNGLLGFGSSDNARYRLQPEFSTAWLLSRNLAIGAEYRFKPDNLAFAGAGFREDDWKDVFIAWAPNKQVSLTAAWVDLGNIVGHERQRAVYVSTQITY